MTIRDYLRDRAVPFEFLLHGPAPTAARLAQSVHEPGGRVAKAVLIRAGGDYVLAVVPATHRVNLAKLRDALGLGNTELAVASEEELLAVFADCQLGARPALGRPYGLKTFVDMPLGENDTIIFEANTQSEGVRMRFADYAAIEAPTAAAFAEAIGPGRRLA